MEDKEPKGKPSLETKRLWQHGNEGRARNCTRSLRPVYTNPDKAPEECRAGDCNNNEWYSRGLVIRDKGTKKILVHNGKSVANDPTEKIWP